MFYDISRFYIFFFFVVLGYVVRVFLVENIIENIFGILYFNLIIFLELYISLEIMEIRKLGIFMDVIGLVFLAFYVNFFQSRFI